MTNSWTDFRIKQHKIAADLCCQIMESAFDLIRNNQEISEYEVQQFIVKQYAKNNMVSDGDPPIVAFRENTSFVHYFPEEATAKKLTDNTLIMIDLWARLDEKDAPFADITWMAWHGGEIPADIQKGFDVTLLSRNKGLEFIKGKLIMGEVIFNKDLGDATEYVIMASGLQDFIPHAYGHSLGTTSCHGNLGVIHGRSETNLLNQVGYTIEPGIYIEGKYGFRSEIDFYIKNGQHLIVTTAVQKDLVRV